MMTFEEKMTRNSSTHRMAMAALDKYSELSDAWHKLHAYNTLFDPPKSIREANKARAERLYKEMHTALDLYKALDKVRDTINAKPCISTYISVLGGERTLIHAGMLPDFSPTSKDETEALKMLADYYARESA